MPEPSETLDFIRTIVDEDVRAGKHGGRVATRFPPEPNGYLHIGHAKSICLNFGVASEYGGTCNLRFDDTNPVKEDVEYVDSIEDDVRWLGFDWDDRKYFASDYFERLYESAVTLIERGKAYVDSLSADEIRAYRGTLTEPGKNSPYRDRSVEENLDLFGACGRASSRKERTCSGPRSTWRRAISICAIRPSTASGRRTTTAPETSGSIYPMYDFAHALSDAFERDHAFAVHPRVRGPPPPVRLGRGRDESPLQAATDRVRPAQI